MRKRTFSVAALLSAILRETDKLLQSVGGVGPITALVLIAEFSELDQLADKQYERERGR